MKVAFCALAAVAAALSHADLREHLTEEEHTTLTYPKEVLPRGNTTVIRYQKICDGGHMIVARGLDKQLWMLHKNKADEKWNDWQAITTVCPSKQDPERKCTFDSDPSIIANKNGIIEIFARVDFNLDVWQMYQAGKCEDVTKWTTPRESSCVDQDQDTGKWHCLCAEDGKPCQGADKHYWNTQPLFPTSDLQVFLNDDDQISVIYRGFDGRMYAVNQMEAGNSTLYSPTQPMTDIVVV